MNWRDLQAGDVICWHYGTNNCDDMYVVIRTPHLDGAYVRMSVVSLETGEVFWNSTRPNTEISPTISIDIGGRREVG